MQPGTLPRAAAPGPAAPVAAPLPRTATFFVDAERQKQRLEEFHLNQQHLTEAYVKNKPLSFRARAYQKTHPDKAKEGRKDADVTLCSPVAVGVADGVSQIEDFGIDPSLLPKEILKACEDLALRQLTGGGDADASEDQYEGPMQLLRQAYEATSALGSLTVVLALIDNRTVIHGKPHPMIAMVTVGDCELLVFRRMAEGRLKIIHHTEMQRIDGNNQTPLQLARVDGRIDPNFHEGITLDVIERGSACHLVSAYEGDIIVMGSDGVFDNLFLEEIEELCNQQLPPGPVPEACLQRCAEVIVQACHTKTLPLHGRLQDAPIGRGGKKDDTSVVVAEMVELTPAVQRSLGVPALKKRGPGRPRTPRSTDAWISFLSRFNIFVTPIENCCAAVGYESTEEELGDDPSPSVGIPSLAPAEAAEATDVPAEGAGARAAAAPPWQAQAAMAAAAHHGAPAAYGTAPGASYLTSPMQPDVFQAHRGLAQPVAVQAPAHYMAQGYHMQAYAPGAVGAGQAMYIAQPALTRRGP